MAGQALYPTTLLLLAMVSTGKSSASPHVFASATRQLCVFYFFVSKRHVFPTTNVLFLLKYNL